MIARLRTLLVVALITGLIWVVAESASLRTQTLSATIVPASTDEFAMSLIGPSGTDARGGEILVMVDGATSRLDAVGAALRSVLRLEPGLPGVPREPGEHLIDLRTFVQGSRALVGSGVRVSSVQPAVLTLRIEPLVSRSVPIRAVLPELDLEGPAELVPAQTTIRLPESLALTLPPDAAATAEVDAKALVGVRSGKRQTIPGVIVHLPSMLEGKAFVSMDASKADVTLTVRGSVVRRVVDDVPVMLRCDPALLQDWDLSIEPASRNLHEVGVTGPPSLVAEILSKLDSGGRGLVAYVGVTREELEQAEESEGTLVKDAVFSDLPSSISFDAKQRSVRMRVQRRGEPKP
jgi:hypothetical protein